LPQGPLWVASAALVFAHLLQVASGVFAPEKPYCDQFADGYTPEEGEIFKLEHGGGARRGHFIPGILFIVWALWWYVNMGLAWLADAAVTMPETRTGLVKSNFLHRLTRNKSQLQSSCNVDAWVETLLVRSARVRVLEPAVKATLPWLGIFVELYFHWPDDICYRRMIFNGYFDPRTANLWNHSTLYAVVAFSGIIDLLVFSKQLPKYIDRVVHVMVFLNEGMIFAAHLKGSDVDQLVHKFIVGINFTYALIATLDFALPSVNYTVKMLRPLLLFLKGTWMMQIGLILFTTDTDSGDFWTRDEHTTLMIVPILFSFHAFMIMTGMLCLAWVFVRGILGLQWKSNGERYKSISP